MKTGADKMIAPLDLPASTDNIAGFSLHPDGNRFLTSIAKWPFDIWMLEGWDQTPRENLARPPPAPLIVRESARKSVYVRLKAWSPWTH